MNALVFNVTLILGCVSSFLCANERCTFPNDFEFGVSTSAYQIEGGWNTSGKGESIWDHFTHHHSEAIKDHSNGDVACDSYNLWQKDVLMLAYLNVHFYRFSISWTRLLPTGFHTKINADAVIYYNNLIDALLARKIQPMVTLYHWDLPQSIQKTGGWLHQKTSVHFAQFARSCYRLFGDRVKMWITINEPSSICVDPYEYKVGAPGVQIPGKGLYMCGKTVLLAHLLAYEVYHNEFRPKQHGLIGITIDSIWAEPKTNSAADILAADREMQMSMGWWAHPIYSAVGNYPAIMIDRIANRSLSQNLTKSRLPALNEMQIRRLRGSADFFGLNHYHTWLVSDAQLNITSQPSSDYNRPASSSYNDDKGTRREADPSWRSPAFAPWGLRKLLNWVKEQYQNPLVFITENGFGSNYKGTMDLERVEYLKKYLLNVCQSRTIDNCNITKYTSWSLMDNMEWTEGYTKKFGLFDVDFGSTARTRSPKKSAIYYKSIIKNRSLNMK